MEADTRKYPRSHTPVSIYLLERKEVHLGFQHQQSVILAVRVRAVYVQCTVDSPGSKASPKSAIIILASDNITLSLSMPS